MKRWVLGLALCAAVGLGGCTAGSLISVIDDLTSGGNDGDVALALASLAYDWEVTRYSGAEVGAVDLPATANMRWVFNADYTFTVTSDQAVSIGPDRTYRYAEAGRWRIVNSKTGLLALTLTRHSGVDLAPAEQLEVAGTWTVNGNQLVVSTAAIGPGTVRYVMSR